MAKEKKKTKKDLSQFERFKTLAQKIIVVPKKKVLPKQQDKPP